MKKMGFFQAGSSVSLQDRMKAKLRKQKIKFSGNAFELRVDRRFPKPQT